MKKGDYLSTILRSNKTVFSITDVALLWQDSNLNAIRVRLNYYAKNGDLYRIRKNFYAKDKNYQRTELANRLFAPSYISFESILAKEGVIFQFNSAITLASYLNRIISIEDQTYKYNKIKDSVLLNPSGLVQSDETTIASKERAILDTLYVSAGFHFDNLRSLDWDKVFILLPIYQNIRLEREFESMYKHKVQG